MLKSAPNLATRRVYHSSGSMIVILPMGWVKDRGLVNGDRVDIKEVGDVLVLVAQKKKVEGVAADG